MSPRSANLLRPKKWLTAAKTTAQVAKRGVLFWAAAFLFIIVITAAGLSGYVLASEPGRFSYGTSIAGVNVSGLTADAARDELTRRLAELRLVYVISGEKADLSLETEVMGRRIVSVDLDNSLDAALAVGHRPKQLSTISERLIAATVGKDVPLAVNVDRQGLEAHLVASVGDKISLAADAEIRISIDARGAATVSIAPERAGQRLDVETAAREAEIHLRALQGGVIDITTVSDQPRVRVADLQPLAAEAAAVAGNAPLTLTAKDQTWTVSRALAADWITALPNDEGGLRLGVNAAKVRRFLAAKAESVYVAPKNASLEEKDGRIIKITPSVDGEELDVDGGVATIESVLFRADGTASVELPTRPVRPAHPTEEVNPYGIKEIIGIGESNFRGSTANRRHNIAVGTNSLSGLIIQPGETFSTLKALGQIDGSTGYRQELVIKGNRTVPEYGGGLCQVGSTLFRATLASGLPITERQNHSYRVSYYERDGAGNYMGPGKDATIYNPAPDFKFVNDTGHAILILAEIEGNVLRFIFWGVKDGRVAEETLVRVYNVVPPPPKKLIETDSLPPGQEKCTESPHSGASAVFTYNVTYADGTVKTKDFYSHYRPWGEVCLIGRDPNAPALTGADAAPASADAAGASGLTGN